MTCREILKKQLENEDLTHLGHICMRRSCADLFYIKLRTVFFYYFIANEETAQIKRKAQPV